MAEKIEVLQIGSLRKGRTHQLTLHVAANAIAKEMASCRNEAKFYLSQCGLSHLDKDSDGIPCEKLCGHGRINALTQEKGFEAQRTRKINASI